MVQLIKDNEGLYPIFKLAFSESPIITTPDNDDLPFPF